MGKPHYKDAKGHDRLLIFTGARRPSRTWLRLYFVRWAIELEKWERKHEVGLRLQLGELAGHSTADWLSTALRPQCWLLRGGQDAMCNLPGC